MLNSIRKFSTSPYAKILLAIIILPFVMWGMGDVFRKGNLNTIAEIENKKISTEEFANNVSKVVFQKENFDEKFEIALSNFIAKKLIDIESENYNILVSDDSLIKIIKNHENFKKDDKFSRTAYEKFLVTNNLSGPQFEQELRKTEVRKQLFDFIAGGIKSPKFLVNKEYNLNKQIRNILTLNLNKVYKKDLNFSDDQVNNFYKKNIEKFNVEFRSVKFAEITPLSITGEKEYNNSFFQKLDEIEDLIASGRNIDDISAKLNLKINNSELFNIGGEKINQENLNLINAKLIRKIFLINSLDPLELLNIKDQYFLVQLEEKQTMPKKITSPKVKDEILSSLRKEIIINKNSELINKIITNKFTKIDFKNLAEESNAKINSIKLNSSSDETKINKKFIGQIYKLPENKMYVFYDNMLNENLLIYIDKVENVSIDVNSNEFDEYFLRSNDKIVQNIYNLYDSYINKKYSVDINYKAAEKVKNYFK